MINPVAVRSNKLKPLNSTLALGLCSRVLTEGRAKWLFLCLYASVPHTLISIYMDGVGENIGQRITPLNPRRLCAWYCIRQGDMVRQDPYRMKRILKGKLVHSVHGLGGDASHPWGNYCQKESNHEQTRSKSTLKPSQRRCTTPPLYHHQSPNNHRRHLC